MVVWSNYSDVTRPHPKWWFSKGNPLISGKSRLVKYYNLARWWFFKIAPQDFGSLVCLQVFVIFKFGIFSQDAPVVTDQHLGWAFFSILKRINCFFGWKTNIYQPIYIYIYVESAYIPCKLLDFFWYIHKTTKVHYPTSFAQKMWLPENRAIKTRPARNVPCAWNGWGNSRSLNVNKLSKRQGIATYHLGQMSSTYHYTISWEKPPIYGNCKGTFSLECPLVQVCGIIIWMFQVLLSLASFHQIFGIWKALAGKFSICNLQRGKSSSLIESKPLRTTSIHRLRMRIPTLQEFWYDYVAIFVQQIR